MGTVTSSHRLITREDALRQPEVNIPIPLENAPPRRTLVFYPRRKQAVPFSSSPPPLFTVFSQPFNNSFVKFRKYCSFKKKSRYVNFIKFNDNIILHKSNLTKIKRKLNIIRILNFKKKKKEKIQ